VEASVRPSVAVPAAEAVDDPKLSTAIAAFARDLDAGRVRTVDGRWHDREELRRLRAALTHLDAELGTRSLSEVAPADVERLVGLLRVEGLPETRLNSITEAFRSVLVHAAGRGTIDERPAIGPPRGQPTAERDEALEERDRELADRQAIADETEPLEPDHAASISVRADAPPRQIDTPRTPTEAVLGVAVEAAKWTERLIVLAFVVVVVVLALELG
jgi:hypothetical protein